MAEAGEQQQQDGGAQDWKAPLMADPELAPHLPNISEKDLPTFVKSHINLSKKLGDAENRIREEFKTKGLLKPEAPATYEVKLPEGVPAEAWSEDDTKIAAGFAKKYGLSQDALNDGIAVVAGILGKHGAEVQVNREASQAKIKEWADKEGYTVEQINSALDRFNKDPRGWDAETAEAISKSGFADNPLVVQAIVKLMADSGTFDIRGDADAHITSTINDIKKEIDAIRFDANHVMHERFLNNDPQVTQHVQDLYKRLAAVNKPK